MSEQEVLNQIEELLKKNNLKLVYQLDFPIYKILPDAVKLALNVIYSHGMEIVATLRPREEKKKE